MSSVALPYAFDTSSVVKLILRGVILLLLIIALALLYSLLVRHDTFGGLLLGMVGMIALYFGSIFLSNLESSLGTITADTVEVEPGSLYGIRLHGPAGRFALRNFAGVRVERTLAAHSVVIWLPRSGCPTRSKALPTRLNN